MFQRRTTLVGTASRTRPTTAVDSDIVTVSLTINPVNQAPTNVGLPNSAVVENSANGTVVGTLSASDPDAGEMRSPICAFRR
jgi:hypothetical protein